MPEITYREALRQTLRYQLQNDERVFLMGEDIGAYGGSYAVTKGFLEEFGERRVKDTPIAESVVVGAGIGAAMAGLKPMVELMTINFSLLAIDQIVNNASKLHYMSNGQINVPIVIRMAGGAGSQLGAQHSHSLESWYAHVPGLKVVVPGDAVRRQGPADDARSTTRTPSSSSSTRPSTRRRARCPRSRTASRSARPRSTARARDVTLIGYSGSVHQACRAAEQLADGRHRRAR